MLARLIHTHEELQLLLSTGEIRILTIDKAKEFLLNFDRNDYYSGTGNWDYDISIEDYKGDTIAFVDNEHVLRVPRAEKYREIMEQNESEFLTVVEYAALHGKQPAIVRRLCQNGRIVGAILKGKTWLIPKTSLYPEDDRIRR